MNNSKPTYLIEAWWSINEKSIYFAIIEDRSFSECREWFEYHKLVNGKAATVFVFFSDYNITDQQVIDTATKFMKGEYIRVDIDLNKCIATYSEGVDKTDPR